jgi:hypothetical protein
MRPYSATLAQSRQWRFGLTAMGQNALVRTAADANV